MRDYEYDVFISHAVEDKIAIANELEKRLKQRGLDVWYSGTELNVGDRLTESINLNLSRCRFGVVIISPTYLTKVWALSEFFTLINLEVSGHKVVLPVMFDITPAELGAKYPPMADIVAVSASKGMDHVVETLYKEIQRQNKIRRITGTTKRPALNKKRIVSFFLVLTALALGLGYFYFITTRPNPKFIESSVNDRIEQVQTLADQSVKKMVMDCDAKVVTTVEANQILESFEKTKSYFRNEYTLVTGLKTIRAKKNVANALLMDVNEISSGSLYTFPVADVYKCNTEPGEGKEKLLFQNKAPVTFTIESAELLQGKYLVAVRFTDGMRIVQAMLDFPSSGVDTKKNRLIITGLQPMEEFQFVKHGDDWQLEAIN